MSTPIESNTEGLQEILQTVYNLPMAGGGSAEPDLVIGLNIADTKQWEDGSTSSPRNLSKMTTDDISIMSGSISAVVEKVKQGLPVKILLNDIHFYWGAHWSKSVAEATSVSLGGDDYPSYDFHYLVVGFAIFNNPYHYSQFGYIRIVFDIDTSTPDNYWFSGLQSVQN